MAKRTITICFKENEVELYNFIKSKRNYSVFLKDIIELAMQGQVRGLVPPVIPDKEEFTDEEKEKPTMAYDDF